MAVVSVRSITFFSVRRMELFRLFRSWCHHDIESLSEKLDKNKLLNVNMVSCNDITMVSNDTKYHVILFSFYFICNFSFAG